MTRRLRTRRKGNVSPRQASAATRTVCVGVAAVSHFTRAADGRTMLFLEEVFVCRAWRGQRLASALLHAAAVHAADAAVVALQVRKYAAQQSAARRFYTRVGFAPSGVPPVLLDVDPDAPDGSAVCLAPYTEADAHKDGRRCLDDVTEYREALPRTLRDRTRKEAPPDTRVQHVPAGEVRAFVTAERSLMREARAHHAFRNGGDGGDVQDLLETATKGLFAVFRRVVARL